MHPSIYAATCESEFAGIGNTGGFYAQLFAKMSLATQDMQAWCYFQYACDELPPVITIDESQYFSPKPASAPKTPAPSGKTVEVLHLSDWHLDPRYDIGSEANCSSSEYMCCRPYSTNTELGTGAANPSVPASRFGSLYCDSPADLALSVFDDMDQFFNKDDLAFTIFTGDIVSHDNDDQLSRAYVEYEEKVTYETFKAQMGGVPIYPTLGNHDSLPEAFATPNNFNGPSGNALSWDYDLLSSLWQSSGWIAGSEAEYAKNHYGAYAHTTKQGLRIISFNSDFMYVDNVYNYVNYTNPDNSGIFKWVADELSACEAAGQRAWVIAHVLSGKQPTRRATDRGLTRRRLRRHERAAQSVGAVLQHRGALLAHDHRGRVFRAHARGPAAAVLRLRAGQPGGRPAQHDRRGLLGTADGGLDRPVDHAAARQQRGLPRVPGRQPDVRRGGRADVLCQRVRLAALEQARVVVRVRHAQDVRRRHQLARQCAAQRLLLARRHRAHARQHLPRRDVQLLRDQGQPRHQELQHPGLCPAEGLLHP